jgi:hypothetical protein
MRKYRSSSPMQDLAPLVGRPISPATSHHRPSLSQDAQEMELDSPPGPPGARNTSGRVPLSEARIRTPLPSGPRLDKPISMPPIAAAPPLHTSLPNIDSIKADLEGTAARVLSSSYSSRYTQVYSLLIQWQDETSPGVISAVNELGDVLHKHYHYPFEIIKIPSSSDGCTNPWRWLSRIINDFTERNDTRDVLKIVYYNGFSFLDDNREMVLSSSRYQEQASTIRWSGIQQILEEACSDTLIIMDAAYYPSSKMVRQRGVMELIAASASEDHYNILDRSSFTRNLSEQLRARATQRLPTALSAADLHSKLLSLYPKMIHDKHPGKDLISRHPSPLHMQMSGNPRLPSITLTPVQPRAPFSPVSPHGPQLTLTIRLTDETLNVENWAEWLRLMPEGIKDVRVEGPYPTTFR